MKIKVKSQGNEEAPWVFSLEERCRKGDAVIYVDVLATQGEDSFYLLRIYPDGTFSRWPGVEPPFRVDEQGRLIEVSF